MFLSRNRAKLFASLHRKKHREETGLFLVEGVRSVQAAFEAGAPLVELVVWEGAARMADWQALAHAKNLSFWEADEKTLANISDVQTVQEILAIAQLPQGSRKNWQQAKRILLLEGVQDPGNVGTLIRTAAWFGVDWVLGDAQTADFFAPKVVRASMGGIWDLKLDMVQDLGEVMTILGQAGFKGYAADLQGTSFQDWQPQTPSYLIAGSEAHGVSIKTLQKIEETVYIEGASPKGVESLNVGVAMGILLQKWTR